MTWNWLVAPLLVAALVAVAYFWGPIRNFALRVSLEPISPTPISSPP